MRIVFAFLPTEMMPRRRRLRGDPGRIVVWSEPFSFSVWLRRHKGGADFACESARFFFERADGEFRTICAIGQIFTDPLLETAGALALRDVDQIVQNQFAIVPCVYANNQSVTKTHAPRAFGNDA